jgi:hypothetical protein
MSTSDLLWMGLAVVIGIGSWVGTAISAIPSSVWAAIIVFLGLERVSAAVLRVSRQLRAVGGELESIVSELAALNETLRSRSEDHQ